MLAMNLGNPNPVRSGATRDSLDLNLGSLLRLFRSEFFDVYMAVSYLKRYANHKGVQDYICNELYKFKQHHIEFFLPQMVHLTLGYRSGSEALERLLLDLCSRSIHFALRFHWYVVSYMHDLSKDAGLNTEENRSRCSKLLQSIEEAVVNHSNPSRHWSSGTSLADGEAQTAAALRHLTHRLRSATSPPNVIGSNSNSLGVNASYRVQTPSPSEGNSANQELDNLSVNALSAAMNVGESASLHSSSSTQSSDSLEETAASAISSRVGERPAVGKPVPGISSEYVVMRDGDSQGHQSPPETGSAMEMDIAGSQTLSPSTFNYRGIIPAEHYMGKVNRCEYFNNELHFMTELTNISLRLVAYPRPERQERLVEELKAINTSFARGVYLPVCQSYEPHHFLLRILPEECIVLKSKERVPYMMLVEVIDTDHLCSSCELQIARWQCENVLGAASSPGQPASVGGEAPSEPHQSPCVENVSNPQSPWEASTSASAGGGQLAVPNDAEVRRVRSISHPEQARSSVAGGMDGHAAKLRCGLEYSSAAVAKAGTSGRNEGSESSSQQPANDYRYPPYGLGEDDGVCPDVLEGAPRLTTTPGFPSSAFTDAGDSGSPGLATNPALRNGSADVAFSTAPLELNNENAERVRAEQSMGSPSRVPSCDLDEEGAASHHHHPPESRSKSCNDLMKHRRSGSKKSQRSAVVSHHLVRQLQREEKPSVLDDVGDGNDNDDPHHERSQSASSVDVNSEYVVVGDGDYDEMASTPHDSLGMKSPARLFGLPESWQERCERLRMKSPHGHLPGWGVRSVIVKANDDLRQEELAMQLVWTFQQIFTAAELPLRLRPYRIIVTGGDCGLIETILNCYSVDWLKRTTSSVTLLEYFEKRFGRYGSKSFRAAQRNFVESMAGYALLSYMLQVKDRHNGNILLDNKGHIVHIDFGFMLSNSPGFGIGFEKAPFKLSQEYIDVMGGPQSDTFNYFKVLFLSGFLAIRKEIEKIVGVVRLYEGVDLPAFEGGFSFVIDTLVERFSLNLTETECIDVAENLILESMNNWRTRQYDNFQRFSQGIL